MKNTLSSTVIVLSNLDKTEKENLFNVIKQTLNDEKKIEIIKLRKSINPNCEDIFLFNSLIEQLREVSLLSHSNNDDYIFNNNEVVVY